MRKLMIKINVALLVFVVIVIIIFVIIKYVLKGTVGVISSAFHLKSGMSDFQGYRLHLCNLQSPGIQSSTMLMRVSTSSLSGYMFTGYCFESDMPLYKCKVT